MIPCSRQSKGIKTNIKHVFKCCGASGFVSLVNSQVMRSPLMCEPRRSPTNCTFWFSLASPYKNPTYVGTFSYTTKRTRRFCTNFLRQRVSTLLQQEYINNTGWITPAPARSPTSAAFVFFPEQTDDIRTKSHGAPRKTKVKLARQCTFDAIKKPINQTCDSRSVLYKEK